MRIECKLHKIDRVIKHGGVSVIKLIIKPISQDLPEFLPTDIAGYRESMLDGINEGNDLIIYCGLKCRVFKDKYFLSINVTKIEKI